MHFICTDINLYYKFYTYICSWVGFWLFIFRPSFHRWSNSFLYVCLFETIHPYTLSSIHKCKHFLFEIVKSSINYSYFNGIKRLLNTAHLKLLLKNDVILFIKINVKSQVDQHVFLIHSFSFECLESNKLILNIISTFSSELSSKFVLWYGYILYKTKDLKNRSIVILSAKFLRRKYVLIGTALKALKQIGILHHYVSF